MAGSDWKAGAKRPTMMLTRCPACQTVFRLRAEQLRARHGEVRCGHCFNPFNALDQLIADPASPQPAPAAEPATENEPPLAPTLHEPAAQAEHPTADEPETFAPASTTPEAVEPPPEGAEPTTGEEQLTNESETAPDAAASDDADTANGAGTPDTQPAEAQPEHAPALLSNLDFDIPDDIVGADQPPRPPERAEPRLDEIDFSSFFEPDSNSLHLPPHEDEPRAASGPGMAAFPELERHYDDDEQKPGSNVDWTQTPEAGVASGIEPPAAAFTLPDVIRAERRSSADTRVEPGMPDHTDAPLTKQPEIDERAPLTEFERHRVDNEVDTDPDVPDAPALDNQHLDATYGKPPQASGLRRTLWGLAVGLLAGILAVQAIYLFRQDVARALPGLRPLLVTACERLGCTMPLPREAAQISIDTSDLQSEPGRPGRFVLHATVKNRADFLQAWPHLELTLTDANDAALVRKVFSPAEWVASDRIEAGFAPRGDAVVRLTFDVTAVAPTGYRVYVFYP